jgi:hypothetical protein
VCFDNRFRVYFCLTVCDSFSTENSQLLPRLFQIFFVSSFTASQMIEVAVSLLVSQEIGTLADALKAMAVRHNQYGAVRAHYHVVGEVCTLHQLAAMSNPCVA